jgi:hypothetical protein
MPREDSQKGQPRLSCLCSSAAPTRGQLGIEIFGPNAENDPDRVSILLFERPVRKWPISRSSPTEGDGDSGLLEARLVGTELLTQTLEFWRRWVSKCRYDGRWREMVNRSALMLKLLTFAPTGAIVAAPTCSLPEEIGGVRNWDYRYTWVRDAAFTLYAFLRRG